MKPLILGLLLLGIIGSAGPATAGFVTYYDGTFNDADWQLTILEGGGGGSVIPLQIASGGDPGEYRRVTDIVDPPLAIPPGSVVYGLHFRPDAVFTPATQGAIQSIDFGIDTIMFSGFGQGESTRLILEQSGRIFRTIGPPFAANQPGWTTHFRSLIQQNDFGLIVATADSVLIDVTQQPDFSSFGAPITFGFHTANSTNNPAGYSIVAGFDDWRVTVHTIAPVPEPSMMVLLVSGAFSCALAARRRRTLSKRALAAEPVLRNS
jgi:hypothetical protein